jgi:hypothetical protein
MPGGRPASELTALPRLAMPKCRGADPLDVPTSACRVVATPVGPVGYPVSELAYLLRGPSISAYVLRSVLSTRRRSTAPGWRLGAFGSRRPSHLYRRLALEYDSESKCPSRFE